MPNEAGTDAMAEAHDLVDAACRRASIATPVVRFAARSNVTWSADGTLLVPHRAASHVERHGRVPTDIARDIALAVAKRTGSDEVEAVLFAEAFVRDHVLNA